MIKGDNGAGALPRVTNSPVRGAAQARPGCQRPPNDARQRRDEPRIRILCRDTEISRYTHFTARSRYSTSSSTSVSVCSDTNAIGTTSTAVRSFAARSIFPVGARPDPFLRRRPRLIADAVIDGLIPSANHGSNGLLYLPLIRVAVLDDDLWQSMCGEQHAQSAWLDRGRREHDHTPLLPAPPSR